MPGSHLPPTTIKGGDGSFWYDSENGEANMEAPTVALKLPIGAALLFDIRTTHRGGANESPSARPILYASYFREWFTDRINFATRQSRWWNTLGEEIGKDAMKEKKLYSRIDSREYTKMLEDMLRERGVDVTDLEYRYMYM